MNVVITNIDPPKPNISFLDCRNSRTNINPTKLMKAITTVDIEFSNLI